MKAMQYQRYLGLGVCFALVLGWAFALKPDPAHPWNLLESDEMWVLEASQSCLSPTDWGYGAKLRPFFVLLGAAGVALGLPGLTATRVVSWLSYLLILLTLGWVSKLRNLKVCPGIILFAFNPLAVYFACIGLPDLMVGGLIFLFLYLFSEAQVHCNVKVAIAAGLPLGLALAAKHQSFIYWAIPFLFLPLHTSSLLSDWRQWFYCLRKGKPLMLNPLVILTLLSASVAFAPFALWVALGDPRRYALGWMRELSAHALVFSTGFFSSMLLMITYWLTWPLLIWIGYGLWIALRSESRGYRYISTGFLLVLPFFLLRPVPRYWVQLVPMAIFLGALGINSLLRRKRLYAVLAYALTIVIMLWQGQAALQLSRSDWFSASVQQLSAKVNGEQEWLFSNFWPHDFLKLCHCAQRAAWLTTDEEDARIFSVSGVLISAIDQAPPALPLEVLRDTGGIVVIVEKPKYYSSPDPLPRQDAVNEVRRLYQPEWIWRSRQFILPFTLVPESVEIYFIHPLK